MSQDSRTALTNALEQYLDRLILIYRIRALGTPRGWRDVLYFYSILATGIGAADFVSGLIPADTITPLLQQFGWKLIVAENWDQKQLPAHDEPHVKP
jgi:hypothetical protein